MALSPGHVLLARVRGWLLFVISHLAYRIFALKTKFRARVWAYPTAPYPGNEALNVT